MSSINVRIKNKRDSAANWETRNPVLLAGELIVVDTNAGDIRFKIGDGVKTYTQLPFQDESLYNVLSNKAGIDHTHTASEVGAAPASHVTDAVKHITSAERTSWNSKAAGDHKHTAADVGAAADDHTHTAAQVGAAPASHATDAVVHVTAAERSKWNAKLDSFTETDPTVPAWAKQATKPTYSASEVGAAPATHVGDTSHVSADDRAAWDAKLDSFTETDPTVPAWAKASSKPTYTATEVGAAPASHATDTTKHITAAERTSWNGKQNKLTGSAGQVVGFDASGNAVAQAGFATEGYVDGKVADLVNSAPETLDTLSELSAALGDDPNFATTIANEIGNKANASEVSAHTGDTVSHITSAERTSWNSKAAGNHTHTAAQVGAAPAAHASDTTIHVTAAEKQSWDAKLDSFTETDPTVPAWAKATSKPTYTAAEVGAAAANHTHTATQVGATPAAHATDTTIHITAAERTSWNSKLDSFTETDPTVPAWAKAATKPSYTAAEVGAAAANHTHAREQGITTGGTGDAYTATVAGLTLAVGASFIMVPNAANTSTAPTLNVNGLGAKTLRRKVSGSTATTALTANYLAASKPVEVTYNGTYWIIDDPKPNVADLYGTLPKPTRVTVTLSASSWDSSKQQAVTVNGVLADESAQLIQPVPAVASKPAYYEAQILCTNQAANSLTFTANTVPTADLTVYIVIQEVS